MKRNNGRRRHHRGHNRKNINNINKNTVLESSGPLSHVRGNAHQLNEKYTLLASDAQSNDDKVLAESYRQFADHYFRLNKEIEIIAEAKNNENHQREKENYTLENETLVNGEDKTNAMKPSRTERSVKAKETEKNENSNLQEKLPKKYSKTKQLDISEVNK